jgi:O-antigen/teichoic acid export membrane protein
MLFSFSTSTLQALQRFKPWALLLIGSNLLRLIGLEVLIRNNQLTVQNILFVFIAMPFLFFGISLIFLPARHILLFTYHKLSTFQLVKFSSWIGISNILWVILSKLDVLLLGRIVSSLQLGIYGIASQLTVVITQLISALAAVLAPRFASFKGKREMNQFLIKFSFAIGGLITVIILLLPLSYFVLPLILGEEYREALPIFIVLIIAGFVLLLATPLHEAIRYFFQKPKVFLYVYSVQLFLIFILGIYFTYFYGILGMAIGVLVGNIANLLLSLFFYKRLFNSLR